MYILGAGIYRKKIIRTTISLLYYYKNQYVSISVKNNLINNINIILIISGVTFLIKGTATKAGQLLSEDWEEEEEGASKSCPRATIS